MMKKGESEEQKPEAERNKGAAEQLMKKGSGWDKGGDQKGQVRSRGFDAK